MRPIVQFLSSKISAPGMRMWAQLPAGPTPFAAMAPGLTMVEPSLAGLPLTPTVRMPRWRREPVTIVLSGSVPRPALRQAAINLVIREVESTGKSCCLQDRMVVNAERLRRAA